MNKRKVILELTIPEFKKLSDYLDAHEENIANGVNDYLDLEDLFVYIFGDLPKTREDKIK